MLAAAGPSAGLEDEEYPGFPADACPQELPDLSQHHSMSAQILKRDPGMYAQLRERRTALGVGLAKCIKTGMDNRGHPLIRTAGAVAGDAECYDTFAPLFDALLKEQYGGLFPAAPPAMAAGKLGGLTSLRPDPSGKYVLSSQVRAARGLSGMRFPPAATVDDRREVEQKLAGALCKLEGPLKGDYFPLAKSTSYPSRPGGMSPAEEQELAQAGMLFCAPDSTTALCSGVGRNWPDARGVFVNESRSFSVWINEEEHLRAAAVRQGSEVQAAFRELVEALDSVEALLATAGGPGFARSDRLGYLTASPVNTGTGLRASAVLRLPLLMGQQDYSSVMNSWCAAERLYARSALGQDGRSLPGLIEVSTRDRLGLSEVDCVNRMAEAVAELVCAERRLEAGGALSLQALPREGEMVLIASPSPSPPPQEEEASWELAGSALGRMFEGAVFGEGEEFTLVDEEAQQAAEVPSVQQVTDVPILAAAPPSEAKPAGSRPVVRAKVVAKAPPPTAPKEDISALRKEIRSLMVGKADTGELECLLSQIADNSVASPPAPSPSPPQVEQKVAAEDTVDTMACRARAASALQAALQSGQLESALEQAMTAHQKETDAIKTRARDALLLGLANGRLEAGLEAATRRAESEASESLEAVRGRVRGALEEALSDGSLSFFLERQRLQREQQQQEEQAEAAEADDAAAEPQPEGDNGVEAIRGRVQDMLQEAAVQGSLEAILKGLAEDKARADDKEQLQGLLRQSASNGSLAEACLAASGAASPAPDAADAAEAEAPALVVLPPPPRGPIAALLEALAVSDRRIGLLEATVREVEGMLSQRDDACAQLEEEILVAQQDARSLEQEAEQHRRILEEQDALSLRLQESRKRLVDGINTETFKQRHAALELDGHPFSARSELSTVCTVHDVSDQCLPEAGAAHLPAAYMS